MTEPQVQNAGISEQPAKEPIDRRTIIPIIHAILLTLVVVGTIIRLGHPFIYNPLDSLYSDPARHFHNAYDVKGEDLASILNAPGFEIYLSTLLRITGKDAFLIALSMGLLSAITPYFYYRWFRELTRDKSISLVGYVLMTFLPSYFRIFAYFMDSVILLPLAGAGLWLIWRAARKQTWNACALAAVVCGACCATKSVGLPVLVLPWAYVLYRLSSTLPKRTAFLRAAGGVLIVLAMYALGPLKVWTHTGCLVLMPDGLYNQRYFESGAHDIEVTSKYQRFGDGIFVSCSIWGSSSVCYPPFYPFSEWMSSREGRYKMDLDYMRAREFTKPIHMKFQDRVKYTIENIIFFFFQYQWPEDNDWRDPFPRNIPTLVRFIWFPLALVLVSVIVTRKRRDLVGWYFITVTLAFMFQQSAVMEGRYKKLWEGVAIGTALYMVAGSRTYRNWKLGGETSAIDNTVSALQAAVAQPIIEKQDEIEEAPETETASS